MVTLTGIPGTIAAEAACIRWLRVECREPPNTRAYRAEVADGILTALVSQDEVEPGKKLWHVSVGHRNWEEQPDRLPTWDELKHAAYRLVQPDVPFVLIFPRRSTPAEGYCNIFETCLHLWESSEPEIDQ